jgi:formate/nitrite transporter
MTDNKTAHAMTAVDNYAPAEIARLVESKGVSKANAPTLTTLALAVLAGAFIALGGVFSTIIGSHSALGFGPTRLLMGVGFSLGLILVVIAGAELFTGNNLVVMSWVSRHITLGQLLRNWAIVYVGNFIGTLSIVFMVYLGGWWQQDAAHVGATALVIAHAKARLSFVEAFMLAILANALVCLAVWLASGGRTLSDKVIAIVFPISAFVAGGFEHSIANMYFIPLGLILARHGDVLQLSQLTVQQISSLTLPSFLRNLLAATLGNIIGGGLLVGLVYWFIYLREQKENGGRP